MADKTTAVGPGADATSPPAGADSPPPAPAIAFNNSFGGTESTETHSTADEWDASKVPPSRFQKRKGSVFATPGSRDGGVASNYAEKFHAKHAEKGYNKTK